MSGNSTNVNARIVRWSRQWARPRSASRGAMRAPYRKKSRKIATFDAPCSSVMPNPRAGKKEARTAEVTMASRKPSGRSCRSQDIGLLSGGQDMVPRVTDWDPDQPVVSFTDPADPRLGDYTGPVSYTHLRAHETVLDLVCR